MADIFADGTRSHRIAGIIAVMTMSHFLIIIFIFALLLVIIFATPEVLLTRYYQPRVFSDLNSVPNTNVALVLGAGLNPDGSPSDILSDRLAAATDLYVHHKVKALIVSGDNRYYNHNEPDAMKKILTANGVPAEAIYADYAGRRTYDSCWRAKNIFGQSELIVVTQSFHMTRSVFLCNALGVKSIGYLADKPRYRGDQWFSWQLRDLAGIWLSLIDVYVRHPNVVGGDQIPISLQ